MANSYHCMLGLCTLWMPSHCWRILAISGCFCISTSHMTYEQLKMGSKYIHMHDEFKLRFNHYRHIPVNLTLFHQPSKFLNSSAIPGDFPNSTTRIRGKSYYISLETKDISDELLPFTPSPCTSKDICFQGILPMFAGVRPRIYFETSVLFI